MKIKEDQAKKALDQRKTLLFSCPAGDRYVAAVYRAYYSARHGYIFDVLYEGEGMRRNPRGSHLFSDFVAMLPGPAQRTDAWQVKVDEEPSSEAGQ